MASYHQLGNKVELYSSPSARSKRELDVQQRREELEKEVSMLHKMLDQEEKVHKILEYMLRPADGSTLQIPSFLPPNTKELLAELVMVEEEIARLEGEISSFQHNLSHEQGLSKDLSISKKWYDESVRNPNYKFSVPSNPNSTIKRLHERMPFETKALHFISKAINGDYTLDGFNSIEKENIRRTTTQKENHGPEEVIGIQEKVSRKINGMQNSASPQVLPRHSTSKPNAPPEPKISFDFPPRSTLESSTPLSESSGKTQPNKLSESIMKCLNFIFLRLVRASRVMELEKSGNISRSTQLSSSSRSFRVETGVNSKTSLPLMQGELRQQDPYGIFDIEDSISRDIGPCKNLVKFASNSMDPKCISSSNSIPLLQKLRGLLESLQKVDLKFSTHQQKLAFWINIYNACVMHGFLRYGVPSSPEKLLALMNKATLNVGGNKINALAIERFISRQPSASSKLKDVRWKGDEDDKEFIVRNIYGLESPEPNVTFALCCGARSSPAVRIYTANNVTSELEKSKLEYLQASIVVTSTKRLLHVPRASASEYT